MKTVRFTLVIVVLLAFVGLNDSIAQWAPNGTHIFNTNTGNVGIGTNTPGTLLHVGKNTTEPTIRVQNLGGTGGSTYQMIDNASGADWKFKATNTGGFKIRDNAAALDVMTIEANSMANALYIDAQGHVGIGTNTPADALHIKDPNYPFIFLDVTTANGNAGITFEENGAYRGWLYYNGANDQVIINAESGGGSRPDFVIKDDGRVCVGTSTPATGYALSINGKAVCTEVLVDNVANWPDYVFHENYSLMSLSELEKSIKSNNHLPGIPAAAEVEQNGVLVGDMQKKLLQKVEELTLYTIEQDKQIRALQNKVEALENSGVKNSGKQ
jgi:hypothetical protein